MVTQEKRKKRGQDCMRYGTNEKKAWKIEVDISECDV
jgi:hypothetical protein